MTAITFEQRASRSSRSFDGNGALDLSCGAHVLGIGCNGIESSPRDISISFRFRIETARHVSYCGVYHAYPPIQPWATAKTSHNWD